MATRAAFDPSLLLDDDGNAVTFMNPTSAKLAGEEMMAKRRSALADKDRAYTLRTGMPKNSAGLGLNEWTGFKGLMALKENAANAQGYDFKARATGGTPTVKQAPVEPWSQGGATDGSAWSQGGATDGSAWGQGGAAARAPQKGAAMPQARAQVPMDDVDAAAQTGSGAAVALARKRQELGLAALENAISRQAIDATDLDGSGRAAVARGRAIQDEYVDQTVRAPRAQASANAIGALAGAAKRDEWQKDWETQAPKRRYDEGQTYQRYVAGDVAKGNAAIEAARVKAAAEREIATDGNTTKLSVEQLKALANMSRAATGEGDPTTARDVAESPGGPLPQPTMAERIRRLQQTRPELTPDELLWKLGDLDDQEEADARAILEGRA